MSADLRGGRVRIATLRAVDVAAVGDEASSGTRTAACSSGWEWSSGRSRGYWPVNEKYFDRIGDQSWNSAGQHDRRCGDCVMATMIDLRLNETIYWLTVVRDDLSAAHVHHWVLRHELRLDGRTDQHAVGLLAARYRLPCRGGGADMARLALPSRRQRPRRFLAVALRVRAAARARAARARRWGLDPSDRYLAEPPFVFGARSRRAEGHTRGCRDRVRRAHQPEVRRSVDGERPRRAGKAARQNASRSSHRHWGSTQERVSPRRILEQQDASHVPELVPIRCGRMLASPLSFFRGAAAIVASDLAMTPGSGLVCSGAATRISPTSGCVPPRTAARVRRQRLRRDASRAI